MSDLSIREQLRISAAVGRRAMKLSKEQVRELNIYIVSIEKLNEGVRAGVCDRCGISAGLRKCKHCEQWLCVGCLPLDCMADSNSEAGPEQIEEEEREEERLRI